MISFHAEDVSFKLSEKIKHKQWLQALANEEEKKIGALNYVFCSDTYLLDINKTYLNHDNYTDIVTFDNSENDSVIEGDIFISIDRILENAIKFDTGGSELQRVMAHGLLHLCGYKDKTKAEKELMTSKENYYLAKISSVFHVKH